jgi:hypothetical protein
VRVGRRRTGRVARTGAYHTCTSKGNPAVTDNRGMNDTDLLAVHDQQPLAARWFSLASYCLESGCNIVTYNAESFRAEVGDAQSAGLLAGYFEATVQKDGRATWTWAWTDEESPTKSDLKEEAGLSESWTRVLSDWRQRALQA